MANGMVTRVARDMGSETGMRLLDVDGELAAALTPLERAAAGKQLVAPVVDLQVGRWTPPSSDADLVGLLVVDGLLGRDVRLAGFPCTELLGSGDVLRPWDQESTIPATVEWTVLATGRLALLDERFLDGIGRWPPLSVALLRRAVRRSQSLATHLAITCLVGIELRLHALFWHLADRWGRMTPAGVILELPLTHESLAHLVRSRRPSVSAALKQLADRDLLVRQDGDRWLLRGEPPRDLEQAVAEQMRFSRPRPGGPLR